MTQKVLRSVTFMCNFSQIFCSLAFCIACFVVYSLEEGEEDDCDTPLQTWVLTKGIMSAISFGLLLIAILSSLCKLVLLFRVTAVILVVYSIFDIVWFILGNIWLYTSEDCEEALDLTYTFTNVILIIQCVMIGLTCCVLCTGIGFITVKAIRTR